MKTALRLSLIIGLLAAFGLAGCGVKGPLERPSNAPADSKPGPDGKKPHRSFILDGLI